MWTQLRHRQHARVADRIREAKATGFRNLPCYESRDNTAWLEAVDLVCWTMKVRFAEFPELARCGIAASANRSCTSPPGSPEAPANYTYASTRPGHGLPISSKASPLRAAFTPRSRSPVPMNRKSAHRQRQLGPRHAHRPATPAETRSTRSRPVNLKDRDWGASAPQGLGPHEDRAGAART